MLGAGCVAPTVRTATAPPSDIPTVQRSAPFAGVSAAYRAGEYRAALAQIQTLSRKPDLSPADRLFLERQEAICRAALGKGSPTSPTAQPTPATPKPRPILADCGPRALHFVCRELGVPASLSALTEVAGTTTGAGSSLLGLARAAKSVGLSARGVQVDADALRRAPMPALAWVDGDHFVAVTRIKDDSATVHDPNTNGKEEVALDTLLRRSGGILLLLEQGKSDLGAAKHR